jgi:hypothetical protein
VIVLTDRAEDIAEKLMDMEDSNSRECRTYLCRPNMAFQLNGTDLQLVPSFRHTIAKGSQHPEHRGGFRERHGSRNLV